MAKKPAPKTANKLPLRPVVAAFGTIALILGMYFAIVWIGQQAGDAVADRPRYKIRFEEIDCPAPPGMDRAAFLADVRFLANPPAEISSADPEAIKVLTAAFAKHPWVALAVPNEATPSGTSPVRIVFRSPTLAVAISSNPPSERVVDRRGILLPATAPTANLPRLLTPQPAPEVAAGEKWINRDVLRALDLARDYDAQTLENTGSAWRIAQKSGRILTLPR